MKGQNDKVIWLAWQKHRRTQSLCEYLDIPMYAETVSKGRLVRYLVLTVRSLKIIHKTRPKVLIVQNPSILLCLLAIMLRPLYRYRLVVDAHNEGVMPYANKSKPFLYLTDFILRKADFTIVTNRFLADVVRRKRGSPLVLPDRLPLFMPASEVAASVDSSRKTFLLICTHAKDEPVQQIFDAVSDFQEEILLLVTGKDDPEILRRYGDIPANVRFTGFLPDAEYLATLAGSDCVIDLTLMEYCLVCGAYEAVSFGKPMILSDDPACREIFFKGTVYTRSDSVSIKEAIRDALLRLNSLVIEIRELKNEFDSAWEIDLQRVVKELGFDAL